MFKRVQRFSIRKLTIGAASVLIGIAFLGIDTNSVHAETNAPAATEAAKNKQPASGDDSAQKAKASAADSGKETIQNNKPDSADAAAKNNTDADAAKSEIENNDKGTSKASAPVSVGQKKAEDDKNASAADEQKTSAKETEPNKQTDNAQNKTDDNKANNDTNDNKSDKNELVIDKSGKNQTDPAKKDELAKNLKEQKLVGDDSKTDATITISGSDHKVFDNQEAVIDPSKAVFSTLPNNQTLQGLNTLTEDDFQWADGTAPTRYGLYKIILGQSGIDKLKDANPNYNLTFTGGINYYIQRTVFMNVTGSQSVRYTGQPAVIDPSKFSVAITDSFHRVLSYPLNLPALTADDFEFRDFNGNGAEHKSYPYNQGPVDSTIDGDPSRMYFVTFSAKGQAKLNNLNPLYHFSFDYNNAYYDQGGDGGRFEIIPIYVITSTTHSDSKTYDGQPAKLSLDKFKPTITVDNGSGHTFNLPANFRLSDFEFVDENGKAYHSNKGPTDVGTYAVHLTVRAQRTILRQVKDADAKRSCVWVTTKFGSKEIQAFVGTYTINKAPVTVNISGSGEKNYDAQPASVDPSTLGSKIAATRTVTGHDLSVSDLSVSGLTNTDFDWYSGSTDLGTLDKAPTNVGTYTIKLNATGLKKLQDNNTNYSFDNVAGSFTYTINKATPTVKIAGTGSKTYDGKGPQNSDYTTAIGLTINAPGNPTITLDNGDYQFVGQDGKIYASPVNAGTYNIELTTQGQNKIKNCTENASNLDWSNVDLTNIVPGTFTIMKASATAALSGSNSKAENGHAVTTDEINDGGHIQVTISVPSIPNSSKKITYTLQDGDYTWDTTDGSAPSAAGTYTIKLNSANILSRLQAQIAADSTWNGNVDLTDANLSGSATFKITSLKIGYAGSYTTTYNGNSVNVSDITTPTWNVTVNNNPVTDFSHVGLTNSDFDWTDAEGHSVTVTDVAGPKKAGTYTLKLNAQGLSKLQGKNSNYSFTLDDLSGSYTITINKKAATIDLSGNDGKTYNGTAGTIDPSKGSFTVDSSTPLVSGDSFTAPTSGSNALTASDFDWYNATGTTRLASAPTAAGTYILKLKDSGLSKMAAANPNYDLTVKGGITYQIKQADAHVNFNGQGSKNYDGNAAKIPADATTASDITATGLQGNDKLDLTGLTDTDFDWYQGSAKLDAAPTAAGNYTIKLNANGLDKLQTNKNYNWGDVTGTYTYQIKQANAHVNFSGQGSKTYDRETATIPADATTASHITATGLQGNDKLDLTGLSASDFDWYKGTAKLTSAPKDAGNYTIKLNADGLAKLQANKNYNWGNVTGTYKYVINKATASASLNGKNNRDYDGSTVTTNDIDKDGNITVTISIPNINKTISYTLQDGDYSWQNGTAPIKAGIYTINLNKDNISAHLQAKIDADSALKGNIDLNKDDLSGSATFTINRVKSTVSLGGNTSVTYDGKQVATPFDKLKQNINSTNSVNNEKLDLSDLTADGFDWYDSKGNKLTGAPTNAGTYTIKLNDAGLAALKGKNTNYALTLSTTNNSYSYIINKKAATIDLSGNDGKTYNGTAGTIDPSKGSFTVDSSTPLESGDSFSGNNLLTAGDFDWYDAVGTTQLSKAPSSAGTYTLKLRDSGLSKLAAANPNYELTVNGGITYKIKAAAANVNFTGSGSKTYDGHPAPVTTETVKAAVKAQLSNDTNLDLDVSGLTDADFDWYQGSTDMGTLDKAPTNAGNYTIKLNDAGLTALKRKNTNYDLTLGTNSYTYKINAAAATINISGSDEKTYDGKAGTIDQSKASFTPTAALPNGETLVIPSGSNALTADDFQWADGTAPIDAGSYKITLKQSGIDKLRAANPNYDLTFAKGITYTIKKANANVNFSGQSSKTYDGNAAIIPDDAKTGSDITATGLQGNDTLDLSGLSNTDFDWYQGNTKLDAAPIAAGTYNIKLNTNGLTKLQTNKNYNWGDVTGTYTYTIKQADAHINFQGNGSKTYDGKVATIPDDATTASDITATGLKKDDKLDLSGLVSADFDWYDASGKLNAAPTTAGTYTIKLNTAGLAKLQANKNYNWGNVTGTYTYIINKATASAALTGSNQMTYSGNSATTGDINKDGKITVTISIPNSTKTIAYTLQDGDYIWNTSDGSAPIKAGSYTIKLNNTNILSHLQAKIAADSTWKGNVDLIDAHLSGSADFKITTAAATVSFTGNKSKTYDGTAATLPDNVKTNSAISADLAHHESLDLSGLTDADFDWYQGNTKLDGAPTAAGNYTIKLNTNGLTALQNKNKNYTLMLDRAQGYDYTIKKATASAALSGSGERDYNGNTVNNADIQKQDDNNDITLKVTIPGQTNPAIVTLGVKDFDWYQGSTKLTELPKDADTYTLYLNAVGKQAISDQLSNNTNIDWTNVDFTNLGHVTYTINKADAHINFSGQGSKTYDGDAATIPDNAKTAADITATGLQGKDALDLSGLIDADFDWYQGSTKLNAAPADAGTYTIKLNNAGLALLQANKNYTWGEVTGTYTYTINPLTITVKQTGSSSKTYDGQPASVGSKTLADDIKSSHTIGGHALDVSGLTNADFDWYQGNTNLGTLDKAPTDAGTYTIKLNTSGLNKLKNNNKNYSFDKVDDDYAYTINPAAATFTFQGNGSKTYDGQPASVGANDLSNDIKSPHTINGHALVVPDLTNVDFDWYDENGTDLGTLDKAPKDAGTYTIKLNDAGLKALNDQNKNYVLTLDSTKSYTYTINKATASAALAGSGERDYSGKTVNNADIQNSSITLTITIPGQVGTQTITLTADDFDWNGKSALPSDVDIYTLSLNDNGKAAIKTKFGDNTNIDWDSTTTSGSATYQIKATASTVTFTGNHSKTYDGKSATLPTDAASSSAIGATELIRGESLDLSGLIAADFDWYKGTTKLSEAPTDAGTYTIKLNNAGLEALKSKNSNYALTLSTTNNGYTYTINKATGTVVFNGNHTETYTGQANAHPAADFSLTLSVQNNNDYPYHPNYTLKDGDLEYLVDGQWVSTVPVNVGKYQVKLSDQGWQDLKQFNGDNVTWLATSFSYANGPSYYTITQASASAELTGSNHRTYNGTAVTTGDINTTGGDIKVTISIPNSNKTITYTLQDGDYSWASGAAPSDAGTYTINLNTDKILDHLKAQIAADSVWKGNVDLTNTNLSGSATFTINKVAITVSQSGSGFKTYNGRPAAMPTTDLTKTGNISANSGLVPGESLKLNGLSASDFDWFDADDNPLNAAPTDAGNYIIKLNAAGIAKLKANNKNYSFTTVGGSYSYTINKANATIKLDPTKNTQTSVWNGSDIPLNLDNFKPVIDTDNPNQATISLPSDFHLTAGDYVITQKGATATAKEPGEYTVTLTEAGWQKVRDAIGGSKNYNWSPTGHGTLTINKASSTITLSGSGSVTYTGQVAQIPWNNGNYKVDLGNGKTYTLRAGDLEFVNPTGNTNVGSYKVKLSDVAITRINELAGDDIAHYKYTYDDHNTATLEIKAAAATATLSGHNSRAYNGQAVTTSDINANGGTIQIALTFPGVTNKIFTLKDGQYTWQTPDNAAPINANSYTLKLNKTGLTALQNYIDSIAGNGNVVLSTTDTGSATFDITAKDIGVVVEGKAHKTYDGENAAITQQDLDSGQVSIKWGTNSDKPTDISFNLSPNDFEVVDSPTGAGNPVSAVNVINAATDETNKTYYIRLTSAAFNRLKNQNKNYKFTLDQENSHAVFLIYARQAALTLSGTQTVNYGTDPGKIDIKKFTVDFSNWITASGPKPVITLEDGDLQVIVDSDNQYSPDKLPINAGQYKVVMTTKLINRLKDAYKNYDFDNIPDVKDTSGNVTKPGQDDKHQPASYIVQPLQIGAIITGKQSVEYDPSGYTIDPNKYGLKFNTIASRDEAAFKGFKLTIGDLEFVTTPGDVGTYQVRLTQAAINRMKQISGINPANYDWTVLAGDLPTANFEVTRKPVTIVTGDKNSSQPQTSVYGKAVAIDPNDYSVTVQDENGQPITLNNISFTADDFEFQGGTPSNVGNYTVVLSESGINKVENALGTKNYSFSTTGNGNYKITAAQAKVSLTGGQSSTYDAHAAQLTNTDGYTLTITTDNGLLDFTLTAGDLQFVDKDGNRMDNPTAAGTYSIALTTDAQNAIKKLGGNEGKNYGFTFNKSEATYTIKKANAKAVFAGNGSKNYDGSAISNYTTPIGITITAPGTATTINLTAGTDYIWTKDGHTYKTAPVDAGIYSIELTDAGKTKIKNVNAANLDWKDTDITGTGTYTIHKVAATVTMGGKQTETYDGSAKPLNLSDFVPTIKSGDLKMPTIPANTFTRADYDVVDGNGNKLSDDQLIKAGTYKVELNASGLSKLKALTGAGNFTWPATVATTGTLTIKQAVATAKLDGSNSRIYNGQFVTNADINNGGTIAVAITVNGQTITYKLQDGDYSWGIPDGLAPTNASSTAYQINLNKGTILAHLQDKIDQTDPALKGNYKLTADDLSGKADFTITKATPIVTFHGEGSKVYDGSALPDNKYSKPIGLTISNAPNVSDSVISLTAGTDYVWVKDGHSYTIAPTDVGTYSIELTDTGKNKIHSTTVNGDNLDWSKVDFANVGTGKLTITAATGKAALSGSNKMTYSGNAATTGNINATGGNITVTISIPNSNRTITYTLQDGDYTWANGSTPLSSAPSDVGTYTINLNKDKILKHLQDKIAADPTWKGNVDLAGNALDGSATFKINAATITVNQSGTGSKTYDGQAASVDLDTLRNDINAPGTASGHKLDASGLTDADFDWYEGNTELGTLDHAPTNAGTYTIKVNKNGLKRLQDQNKNYSFTKVNGQYTYTINKATATVSMSGTQDSTWSGNPIAIDPSKFAASIKTNNGLTLNIPDGVHLTAGDFEYVDDAGKRIDNPSEVGKYKVRLTAAGLQKLESATNNYTWTYDNSEGTVNINKATATIKLNGSSSVTYTGQVAQIPYDQYTVTLSNGDTYTLKDGDLQFVSTGNTDVGTYTVKLSAAGLAHIREVAGNHYTYTYDDSTATLEVTPAEATATLNGSGSHEYDGNAAKLSEGHYTVTLSNNMTYTLKDGDYTWAIGSAPTNVGNYKIILTEQGQDHIKALSSNYKWTFTPSKATFDVTAQRMGIVVDGEASKTWDGAPAKITSLDDLKNITINWGNSSTEPNGVDYHFKPSDFVVVDAAGNPVSDVNYDSTTGKTTKTYYVRLKQEAIDAIQNQTKNYQFVFDKDNSKATYTIYARKAALTLNGSQTVNYGTDPGQLDPDKFSVDFSNWIGSGKPTITLQKGDLKIVLNGDAHYSDGLPINAGTYKVIMTDHLINRLKNDGRFSNYDFTPEEDNPSSGVDDKHQPAVYNVQPLQIVVTINGNQSVEYGSHNYNKTSIINNDSQYSLSFGNIAMNDQGKFNGYKLQQGDLEFVTTPGDVGTYQVKLSAKGIEHLKALGTNFNKNYDWSVNVDNARGNFEVTQATVTVTVSDHDNSHPQSSEFGQTPTINPDDYTLTIKTDAGQTLSYTPVAGDLDFENGTPSDVGNYTVVLSAQGLANIKNKFGIKNYTYKSAGHGNYKITAAKATVTLSGNPSSTYDANPISMNSDDYSLNIQTDNGATLSYTLHNSDLIFTDDKGNVVAAPTNAGTYQVRLTTDAQKAIKALGGNNGQNYAWTWTQTASYKINQAAGTATVSGDVHKDYDGSPISNYLASITVTVNYPGVGNNTTYTLKDGDYEFVKDGKIYTTAPSDAGTYEIVLTKQGKDNIAKLGNGNIDWSSEHAFIQNASYTINPIAIDVDMNGKQTKTYDGRSFDPSKFVPTISAGNLTMPNIPVGKFTADDFTVIDSQNKVVTDPVNVGTYKVELNSNGLKKLKGLITSSNYKWPASVNTTGTLTIQAASANAKLSGSNSKTEDGHAVTTVEINNDGDIKVTISIPNSNKTITYTLQDGDYTWANGAAPSDVGTYTINLNKDKILSHLRAKIAADSAWNGNVDLTDANLSGSATFEIKSTTQPTNPQPDQPTNPTPPTKPVEPTKPNKPTEPAKPTKPGKPAKPNKPAKPGKPGHKPGKPNKPGKQSQHHGSAQPTRRPGYNHNGPTKSQTTRWSSNNRPLYRQMPRSPYHYANIAPESDEIGQAGKTRSELAPASEMGRRTDRYDQNGRLLPQTDSHNTSFLTVFGLAISGLAVLLGLADKKKKKR